MAIVPLDLYKTIKDLPDEFVEKGVLPIENGGTNGTSTEEGRLNLGITPENIGTDFVEASSSIVWSTTGNFVDNGTRLYRFGRLVILELSVNIKSYNNDTSICTLPEGYRPLTLVGFHWSTETEGGVTRNAAVRIDTSGLVKFLYTNQITTYTHYMGTTVFIAAN